MYTIAIQPDDQYLMSGKRQSFSTRWEALAQRAGHEVRRVDALKADLKRQLEGCDGFMWWFAHCPFPRNAGKRLFPAIEHGLGIPCFPNWQTVWHFDDKLAQTYLLETIDVPMPQTWIFWEYDKAIEFCRTAAYPLVLKLTSGIVSENVKLLHTSNEAVYWILRLFGAGVGSLDRGSILNPRELYQRLRGAALLILKGTHPDAGRRTDLQKGYFLAQEFLTGNTFDTRVTIIGKRAFAFRRHNRPNDFRASGSGKIDFDTSKIDLAVVRLAFQTALRLGTQSLAVDALYRDGKPVLSEISYYYEGWALADCPGHWELQGEDPQSGELKFIAGHMLPEDAIFEDFIALLNQRALGAGAQMRPSFNTTASAPARTHA